MGSPVQFRSIGDSDTLEQSFRSLPAHNRHSCYPTKRRTVFGWLLRRWTDQNVVARTLVLAVLLGQMVIVGFHTFTLFCRLKLGFYGLVFPSDAGRSNLRKMILIIGCNIGYV